VSLSIVAVKTSFPHALVAALRVSSD
jgi:hypothetical protein